MSGVAEGVFMEFSTDITWLIHTSLLRAYNLFAVEDCFVSLHRQNTKHVALYQQYMKFSS